MSKVYFLSLKEETPNRDYWDYAMLTDVFNGEMWNTGVKYDTQDVDKLPKAKLGIVVVPARHHAGLEPQINKELSKLDKVALFLMGDEEADFKVESIDHPNITIWVQNPHPGRHDNYKKIGTGYTPHCKPKSTIKDKSLFFSGQITHSRRRDLIQAINDYHIEGDINATKGFTQGFSPQEYIERMSKARVVPAPSGAVIPDSFRLYEALECMCVPIADEVNPSGSITEYWDWLLGDNPIPKIVHWPELAGKIEAIEENYPDNMHQIVAWWINWKREFAYEVANA